VMLGFFEAGQWPCALAASQRLLSRRNRPLGNSILQSGASLGAIVTPIVVLLLNDGEPGSWRLPFRVIGAAGLVWVFAWLAAIHPRDLEVETEPTSELPPNAVNQTDASAGEALADSQPSRGTLVRRLLALMVVVISINLCWQYF